MPTVELIERSIWRIRMITVSPSTSKAMIETLSIRSFRLWGLRKRGFKAVVSAVRATIKRTKLASRLRVKTFSHHRLSEAPLASSVIVVG